jgi:hypothetical protein
MNTTYTIYHPDGSVSAGEVAWPENPSYELIRLLVEPIIGGPLERVRVLNPKSVEADELTAEDYLDMFVDEMGHPRRKPRNDAATAIYRANWLRAEGGDPEDLHWIAGTAIVFDRQIWK